MSTAPETYCESGFEEELGELLALAKDAAFARCDANACGTKNDFDNARALEGRLVEHHEHFLARWERLATRAAAEL